MGIFSFVFSKGRMFREEEMKRREKSEVEEACGRWGQKVF
jgi:hypothetical protein